jgi:hypothetical protein
MHCSGFSLSNLKVTLHHDKALGKVVCGYGLED